MTIESLRASFAIVSILFMIEVLVLDFIRLYKVKKHKQVSHEYIQHKTIAICGIVLTMSVNMILSAIVGKWWQSLSSLMVVIIWIPNVRSIINDYKISKRLIRDDTPEVLLKSITDRLSQWKVRSILVTRIADSGTPYGSSIDITVDAENMKMQILRVGCNEMLMRKYKMTSDEIAKYLFREISIKYPNALVMLKFSESYETLANEFDEFLNQLNDHNQKNS